MINNTVSLALYKLQLHKDQGSKSTLTIHEVANLMDIIKGTQSVKKEEASIFFGFSVN